MANILISVFLHCFESTEANIKELVYAWVLFIKIGLKVSSDVHR